MGTGPAWVRSPSVGIHRVTRQHTCLHSSFWVSHISIRPSLNVGTAREGLLSPGWPGRGDPAGRLPPCWVGVLVSRATGGNAQARLPGRPCGRLRPLTKAPGLSLERSHSWVGRAALFCFGLEWPQRLMGWRPVLRATVSEWTLGGDGRGSALRSRSVHLAEWRLEVLWAVGSGTWLEERVLGECPWGLCLVPGLSLTLLHGCHGVSGFS